MIWQLAIIFLAFPITTDLVKPETRVLRAEFNTSGVLKKLFFHQSQMPGLEFSHLALQDCIFPFFFGEGGGRRKKEERLLRRNLAVRYNSREGVFLSC